MKNEIHYTTWPYHPLDQELLNPKEGWVVFFGADFYNMTEINVDGFIEKTNQCLEYVRKNYPNSKLLYRPHPDEDNEINMLDLGGFSIERDGEIAEDFLWKNREKIRVTFSVCSTSSISSFNMGLDSHSFYPYFAGVFSGTYKLFVDKYFSKLPDSFFINNLASLPVNSRRTSHRDAEVSNHIRDVLLKYSGPVWFIVTENRFLLLVTVIKELIKEIEPTRSVNLVISRHHRWKDKTLDELRVEFDSVLVFPRHFYSLKPRKLISAFRTAQKIKKLAIDPQSIFIGFAHHNFIENCLVSYHKQPYKIAFLPEPIWEINFNTETNGFPTEGLFYNKAGRFYNKWLEPWLGLNKTLFREYRGESGLYFIRLKKPIEEIYDQVYLLRNSPVIL